MYYILWFIGVTTICMISAVVGIIYERNHGDQE